MGITSLLDIQQAFDRCFNQTFMWNVGWLNFNSCLCFCTHLLLFDHNYITDLWNADRVRHWGKVFDRVCFHCSAFLEILSSFYRNQKSTPPFKNVFQLYRIPPKWANSAKFWTFQINTTSPHDSFQTRWLTPQEGMNMLFSMILCIYQIIRDPELEAVVEFNWKCFNLNNCIINYILRIRI